MDKNCEKKLYAYNKHKRDYDYIGILKPKQRPPTGTYICKKCKDVMIPCLGKIIKWHWRHKGETNCKGESDEHICAKYAMKEYLHKIRFNNCKGWKKGYHGFQLCNRYKCFNNGETGKIECPFPINGHKPRYADCGIVKDGKLLAAGEIWHKHAVDTKKYKDLKKMGYCLLEVKCNEFFRIIFLRNRF